MVSNEEKKLNTRRKLFGVLSDGQWHQNKELREKTKISPRILQDHLNQMKRFDYIDKKEDVKNGKYAVFFKATPRLLKYIQASTSMERNSKIREELSKGFPDALNESKDPYMLLDLINFNTQFYFTEFLTEIQQGEKISKEIIDSFVKYFLLADYEHFISKLIRESCKMINKIDIRQCEINQLKRQIEVNEKVLKIYGVETEDVPSENAAQKLS
jgi:DNA-binding HxlR family transcriptional regulator